MKEKRKQTDPHFVLQNKIATNDCTGC